MAGVERPEIEIVEGEVPAAAGEVAEAAVPSPKASGPVGPPATPSAVASGVDPNKVGQTVTGLWWLMPILSNAARHPAGPRPWLSRAGGRLSVEHRVRAVER